MGKAKIRVTLTYNGNSVFSRYANLFIFKQIMIKNNNIVGHTVAQVLLVYLVYHGSPKYTQMSRKCTWGSPRRPQEGPGMYQKCTWVFPKWPEGHWSLPEVYPKGNQSEIEVTQSVSKGPWSVPDGLGIVSANLKLKERKHVRSVKAEAEIFDIWKRFIPWQGPFK